MKPGLSNNFVIVAALIGVGFGVAWLRFRPHLGSEGQFTDGVRTFEVADGGEVRYAVWQSPSVLSEGDGAERRPTLSPDGRFLVFASGERGLGAELYIADWVEGRPVDPRPLAILNSPGDDWAPRFGPDALYFASDRVGGRGGLDLYRAPYSGGVFSPPEPVGGGINSAGDDTDPAPVPGTDQLVFASVRGEGALPHYDLYLARREAAGEDYEVEPLEAVNSAFDERDPAFTADGRALLFASNRSGGAGDFDLYRSGLGAKGWVPPVALEGLNTPGAERGPDPSPDGFVLRYEAARGGEDASLWQARTLELFRTPGRPVGWKDMLVLAALLLVALLAWLAKRWEQLEALYKCVLVSLIAHLLLMWFLRDVYPQQGEYDLVGESDRIRVRMVASGERSSESRRERGGAVEATRSERESESTAERHSVETGAMASIASASAARASRSEAEASSSPGRSEAELPERTADASPSVAVQSPQETVTRREGAAPQVEVAATNLGARSELATRESLASAERSASASSSAAAPSIAGPAAFEAQRESGTSASAPDRVADTEAAPTLERTEVAQEVASPSESVSRLSADRPELSLDAPRASDRPDRMASTQAASKAEATGAPAFATELQSAAPEARTFERNDRTAQAAPTQATSTEAPSRFDPNRISVDEARVVEAVEFESDAGEPLAMQGDAADFERGEAAAPELTGAKVAEAREDADLTPTARQFERGSASEAAPERLALPTVAESSERRGASVALEEEGEEFTRDSGITRTLADSGVDTSAQTFERQGEAMEGPRSHTSTASLDVTSTARSFSSRRAERHTAEAPQFTRSVAPSHAPSRATIEVADASEAEATEVAVEGGTQRAIADSGLEVEAASFSRRDTNTLSLDRTELSAPRLAAAPSSTLSALEAPGPSGDLVALAPERSPWDHTPYQSRTGSQKLRALEMFGGDEKTEAAVAGGLAYLASIQRREGYWGRVNDKNDKYRHVTIGKTGLSVLAFLGAGHTQDSGSQYSPVVEKAVRFLLAVQDDRTGHFGDSGAYSHGIATYALAESYALTEDERLREPLEKAVAWILRQQMVSNDARIDGGWGYYYPDGEIVDRWPRTSVAAWQVMALESARLGGLTVPDEAFDRARNFLVRSWDGRRGAFRYSHDPGRLNDRYPILPGSTPASLFCLSLLGEDISGNPYRQARAFVLDRAPERYRFTGTDDFVFDATGNLYFWYYGTLSMFRVEGSAWTAWNESMKNTLLPAQQADGSWRPISVYATEYAGDDPDDRAYSTAMCVLTLEVYYRYFTPLLEVE